MLGVQLHMWYHWYQLIKTLTKHSLGVKAVNLIAHSKFDYNENRK